MTDLALLPPGVHAADTNEGVIDLSLSNGDLVLDEGLETAVLVSLFTDARAEPYEIPEGQTDPRGWWGDIAAPADGIGSRLWTLAREKSLNAVAVRAEEYAREALQWLVDDGVVSEVSVEAEIQDRDTVAFRVGLARTDDEDLDMRFNFNWRSQLEEIS